MEQYFAGFLFSDPQKNRPFLSACLTAILAFPFYSFVGEVFWACRFFLLPTISGRPYSCSHDFSSNKNGAITCITEMAPKMTIFSC